LQIKRLALLALFGVVKEVSFVFLLADVFYQRDVVFDLHDAGLIDVGVPVEGVGLLEAVVLGVLPVLSELGQQVVHYDFSIVALLLDTDHALTVLLEGIDHRVPIVDQALDLVVRNDAHPIVAPCEQIPIIGTLPVVSITPIGMESVLLRHGSGHTNVLVIVVMRLQVVDEVVGGDFLLAERALDEQRVLVIAGGEIIILLHPLLGVVLVVPHR